jgi:hypothetical protein
LKVGTQLVFINAAAYGGPEWRVRHTWSDRAWYTSVPTPYQHPVAMYVRGVHELLG